MFTLGPYTVRGNQVVSVSFAGPGERGVATVERPDDQRLVQQAPEMYQALKDVVEDGGDISSESLLKIKRILSLVDLPSRA